MNLVSGRHMRAGGITFDMQDCTLRHDGQTIGYASEVNGLFQLYLRSTPDSSAFSAGRGFKISFETWHRRLGHLGHANIERLAKLANGIDLKDLPRPSDTCDVCVQANQTCRPYNHSIQRVSEPLGLIHSDISGPITSTG